MQNAQRVQFDQTFDPTVTARDVACFALLVIVGGTLYAAEPTAISYGLLALAALAALVSPQAAVGSIAAAIPLVQHPVSIGDSNWRLLELSIGLAVVAVSVRLALDVVVRRSLTPILRLIQPYRFSALALMLAVLGLASLFSLADDRFRADSVRELRWVIVEPVAALILFRWAIRGGFRAHVVLAFVGTGVAVAAYGLIQLALGNGVVIADGVERATGSYRHPNNLALYLERVSVFSLAAVVALRARQKLLYLAVAIAGIGLVATLSRGAAMGVVAGAIWIVVALRVRHGWRWILAGAVAGSIVIGIVAAERVTDRGGSGDRSSRELIWSSSVAMIRDHPVTGVGLDQFLNQYGRRYVEPAGWPERYTSHPHNIVLDFWLRLGVLGLAWLVLFVTACGFAIGRIRVSARQEPLAMAAAAALIAGAVHGLVDNSFFLPDLAVATWLFVALIEPAASNPSMGDDDG